MTEVEIERLSLRLQETAKPVRDYGERRVVTSDEVVEVERFPQPPFPEAECE